MNTKELRKLNKKELEDRLSKKKEEAAAMQFEIKIGKETDTAEIKYLRKEVARILTILKEGNYSKEEKAEKSDKAVKKSKSDK